MSTKDLNEEKEQEQFLARWSRLKQEAQDQPPQKKAPEKAVDPKAPPPELPPVEKLTFDSDYRAFFHPKVDEDVRRAALKKLFSDPRFNVMDGLDVYIDDYSKTEPIPAAMLAQLKQAQNILAWAKGDDAEQRAPHQPGQVQTTDAAALKQQQQDPQPAPSNPPTAVEPAAGSPAQPGQDVPSRP